MRISNTGPSILTLGDLSALDGIGSVGTPSRPLEIPPELRDPINGTPTEDWSGVPRLDQGSENSCGTTGLTMIMDYLLGGEHNQGDIDDKIRRNNWFGTSPTDLADYAKSHGLEAGMYNNSSIDEIKDHIRQGHAVQVSLTDPYDTGSGGIHFKDHYVMVTGFETYNGQEYVKIRDPNGDNNPNAMKWGPKNGNGDYLMPLDVFQKKWGGGTTDGFNNFMIVYAKGGTDLPSDRLDGVEHSLAMAKSFKNFANNFDRVFDPDNFGDWVHGLIGAVGGAVPLLYTGVGWVFSALGKGLRDWANDWPPVLRGFGMAIGDIVDMPGAMFTQVGQGFSNGYNDLGQAADDLLHGRIADAAGGVFDAAYDVGKGFVNGTVDVVKDAGKAVGDFASDVGDAISDLF